MKARGAARPNPLWGAGDGPGAMELICLRHGPAMPRDPARWPDDGRRPLSREGVTETREAAEGLVRWTGPIDRLLVSPARRARETAEIVRNALPRRVAPERRPELGPDRSASELFQHLAELAGPSDRRVLLVGHEPQLGSLVALALTGEETMPGRLARAGAAAVEFPRAIRPLGGRLLWWMSRRQLRASRR